MMDMDTVTKRWIPVLIGLTFILGSGVFLILQPDKFEIQLADGTIKANYHEGELTLYKGISIASRDSIQPYYWNGKGYTKMYKSRGTKYSNLSYIEEGGVITAKQTILFSKGNLTRYFKITDKIIKESFEWTPDDQELRSYFLWNYEGLDRNKEAVYFSKDSKITEAQLDFNITNNWGAEAENTVRVERYKNGKLSIRTKVFQGNAEYDPKLSLKDQNKVKKTKMKNKTYINELRSKDNTEEKNGKVKEYKQQTKKIKIIKNKKTEIEMELISQYHIIVGVGTDTKVAEFRLIDWDKRTEMFDELYFFDNDEDVIKPVTFKYSNHTYQKELCVNTTEINVSFCFNRTMTDWTNATTFESLEELPNKNISIGIYTSTILGETIEWVPVIDDFVLYEWAEYDVTEVDKLVQDTTPTPMYQSLIKMDDTHYILAYSDSSLQGIVKSFSIDSNYEITQIDSYTFSGTTTIFPKLQKIDDTHFLIAYSYLGGQAETFSVDANYDNIASIDSIEFDIDREYYGSWVQMNASRYVIAYAGGANDGFIALIDVSPSYTLTKIYGYEHDTGYGIDNSLLKINDTHVINAYGGNSNDGFLRIFEVNDTSIQTISSLEHDIQSSQYNSLVEIDENHYMLAYKGSTDGTLYNKGYIKTFNRSGTTMTQIDSYVHELVYAQYNSLIQIDSTHYQLASAGDGYTGEIKTFEINGGYEISQLNNITQDTSANTDGWYSLVLIDSTHSILAYTGETGDGIIKTFAIEGSDVAPTYSDNSTSEPAAGAEVSHNLKWTDTVGLSGYIFSFDNGTGTFVNDSFVSMSGTTDWSNVSKTINSTIGSNIRWCVYANDTSDNWNTTSCDNPFTYTSTGIDEYPTYSDNSTTTPVVSSSVNHSLKWTDDNGLSGYIFSWCNGTWNGSDCIKSTLVQDRYITQRGLELLTADTTYIELDTPVQNISRAFVKSTNWYYLSQVDATPASGSNIPAVDSGMYSIRLYNTTHIEVIRTDSTTDNLISWNLIEALDEQFTVYRGTHSLVDGDGTEFFIDIGATITNDTALAFQTGISSTDTNLEAVNDLTLNADPYNTTHIRFTRYQTGSGYSGTMNWIVVDFDSSKIDSIQTGVELVTTQYHASPKSVTINEINTSCSLLLVSSTNDDSGLEQMSPAVSITSSTTLSMEGYDGSENRYVRYYVIDFGEHCGYQDDGWIDGETDSDWTILSDTTTDTFNLSRTAYSATHSCNGNGLSYGRTPAYVFLQADGNSVILYRTNYGQASWVWWNALELPYYSDTEIISEWVNDSFVSMSGTTDWSNVTKNINSTEGITYAWCVYSNDTSNQWNTTSCDNPFTYTSISGTPGTPDINLSFGPPGTTLFRFTGCGPDKTNTSSIPEGQTNTYGIDKVCNNGTATGNLEMRISEAPNTGWVLYSSNTSTITSNNVNLSDSPTTYKRIYSNLAKNTCTYIWWKAECTEVTANPGAYGIYNITI